MTRLDEIIANALAGIPETDVAILAREVVRLRGATSVVVPELTNSEKCKATREWFMQPEQRDYNKNDPVVNLAFMAGMDEGYSIAISRVRAIPADRVLGDGQERIHAESESPTEKGWYECWAVDGRWGVRMQYRAWGNGCWWTPLADGWVSSKDGVYKWRGPVTDIGGTAPDGTNPGSIRSNQGGADHE